MELRGGALPPLPAVGTPQAKSMAGPTSFSNWVIPGSCSQLREIIVALPALEHVRVLTWSALHTRENTPCPSSRQPAHHTHGLEQPILRHDAASACSSPACFCCRRHQCEQICFLSYWRRASNCWCIPSQHGRCGNRTNTQPAPRTRHEHFRVSTSGGQYTHSRARLALWNGLATLHKGCSEDTQQST